jgi:inosine-uridine nucleoside N-ribohydrolase
LPACCSDFLQINGEGLLVKQSGILSALVSSVFLLLSAGAFAQQRVIIDTDPGVDDAMAILLALNSPELKVEAITVVPGNVDGRQGLENALKLVSLAGRCDLVVAGGAQHPLNQKLITAQFWHGRNGLANVDLPGSKCKADPRFGPDLIIELVHKYPHEITLIPVGPLTNIALAVSKDPSIVPLVKNVVIMGGSIGGGNVNGAAEANIYGDPEAASIVFNAGWMVTMVGSDVGERTLITRRYLADLQALHGPESDFIAKLADFYLSRSEKSGISGSRDVRSVGGCHGDRSHVGHTQRYVRRCGDQGRVYSRGDGCEPHGLQRKQRVARRSL